MAGTLGLTLEPGGMARFQADLVIPQWLANQVYGLLEALSRVRLSADKSSWSADGTRSLGTDAHSEPWVRLKHPMLAATAHTFRSDAEQALIVRRG